MQNEINMLWQGGMAFETELDGHKIVVDTNDNDGSNKGPRPKALMLVALGGCTGMDIVMILKKMRVAVDYFNMRVVGNLTNDYPKHYNSIKLVYELKGKGLTVDKVKKAIDLSMERYCGVSAVYRKALDLSYEIVILDN